MICLRCGYCCKQYMVMIISDPDKGFREDNVESHGGDGVNCRHLEGSVPGHYTCKVHDRKWYKRTPCYSHGQIESSPDTPCRMGEFVIKRYNKEKNEKG